MRATRSEAAAAWLRRTLRTIRPVAKQRLCVHAGGCHRIGDECARLLASTTIERQDGELIIRLLR
jgi:hypothetical protein